MDDDALQPAVNTLPIVIGLEASLAVIAWVVGSLFGLWPLETLTWNGQDFGWGVLATVPLFVGLALIITFPYGPLGNLIKTVDELIGQVFREARWFDLALVSLMAGIGEELLFRGVVQNGLAMWTDSTEIGLYGAAVLFGLAHSVSRTYVVLAGVTGLFFGWLWLATGNLLTPIVAHALYDFGALCYLCYWRTEPSSD